MIYMTGYNGTVRTRAELEAWSQWRQLDPEDARRSLAMMDDSIVAGRPLGIGSIFRTEQQQRDGFLSRHHVVKFGGCCTYNGQRYALNKGVAHMAPPFRSYHEATTKAGKALAIDWTGNMAWLAANCARYGLNQFGAVNNEPWHSQPAELPHARSRYVQASMDPLREIRLPGTGIGSPPSPPPQPTRVYAPAPTIKVRRNLLAGSNDAAQVRALQLQCNFWGWRDAMGRNLIVDGRFAEKSAQAVMSMQRALSILDDGIYGPMSARRFQQHLDAMVKL